MKRKLRGKWRSLIFRSAENIWKKDLKNICNAWPSKQLYTKVLRYLNLETRLMAILYLNVHFSSLAAIVCVLCLFLSLAAAAFGLFRKPDRRKFAAAIMHIHSNPDHADQVKKAQAHCYFLLSSHITFKPEKRSNP